MKGLVIKLYWAISAMRKTEVLGAGQPWHPRGSGALPTTAWNSGVAHQMGLRPCSAGSQAAERAAGLEGSEFWSAHDPKLRLAQ